MKALIIIACLTFVAAALQAQPKEKKTKILRHMVLFKFKETATAADIDNVIKDFAGLKAKIKQIKGFEWGLNNSPENLNQGLTHGFIITFSSEKDRDDYLVHPVHKEFANMVGAYLDKVVVLDFWVQ